jgi:hypothetical protein
MVKERNVATVWGALALLLALGAGACDADRAGGATGPAMAPRAAGALPAGATVPAGAPSRGLERRSGEAPAATAGGFGIAAGPMSYRDANGHLYEVRLLVGADGDVEGAQHLRDGSLFAQTSTALASGTDAVSVYADGQLILGDIVQSTRGVFPSGSLTGAAPRSGRIGGPQRMAYYNPCGSEWGAYGEASAEMVAAGAWYSFTRTNKARLALVAAVGHFVGAWADLASCMMLNG